MLAAVVFDVDGTLVDTERDGHRPAFNRAFADRGLAVEWDVETYGRLLAITGGRRRIEHDLASRGYPDAAALAVELHRAKTRHFVEWVRSGPVTCRPGVDRLIDELRRDDVRVGVATTGTGSWVHPLLERVFGPDVFDVIVTGDDVETLKPAPDAYLVALDALGVPPARVLAVEDSMPGLGAAVAADLRCLVVTNGYTAGGDFAAAAAVVAGYESVDAASCAALLR